MLIRLRNHDRTIDPGRSWPGWRMPIVNRQSGNSATIRLSSNENPYGPSRQAVEAMKDAVDISNRYQWQMIRDLLKAISLRHNVAEQQVLLGAGSTQVIDSIVRYCARRPGKVVVANPTFSRWLPAAEKCGLAKVEVPLTGDKQYDLEAMLSAIRADTRLVYVCNPNNPTGAICESEPLRQFVRSAAKRCVVIVDEAYLDYAGADTLCTMTAELENLIIVRTFSKIYGMAGARAGYAIGDVETILRIGVMVSGANVGISAVSLAGALASLKDEPFLRRSFEANAEARSFTAEQLERMGIHCIRSHTNFIYFSLERFQGDFFALLQSANIEGTNIFEVPGKWSRITVGTMREMEAFIKAIS